MRRVFQARVRIFGMIVGECGCAQRACLARTLHAAAYAGRRSGYAIRAPTGNGDVLIRPDLAARNRDWRERQFTIEVHHAEIGIELSRVEIRVLLERIRLSKVRGLARSGRHKAVATWQRP